MSQIKVFSMFSGVAGFEYGIQQAIGDRSIVVGHSEIDKYASAVYEYQYGGHNFGDATKIDPGEIEDFDLLVGGFPCQAFSIAGKRKGFEDTRGTLFFEIARILRAKQPKHFILENVKGLLSHDNGETFRTIIYTLAELGYGVEWQVLNSKNFGVPQNRERVFIVGHLGGISGRQVFPLGENAELSVEREIEQRNDIAHTVTNSDKSRGSYIKYGSSQDQKISTDISQTLNAGHYNQPKVLMNIYPSGGENGDILSPDGTVAVGTLRTHKDDKGFRVMKDGVSPTIQARAREDGSGQPVIMAVNTKQAGPARHTEDCSSLGASDYKEPKSVLVDQVLRRLTPIECERLQGFPSDWTKYGIFAGEVKEISDTQRYKMLGNAVTTNVVREIVKCLFIKGAGIK